MPAGKPGQPQGQGQGQGQPQGQGRQNGGAGQGGQPSPNVAQRVQEGAEQVGQRVREGLGTAQDELGRRYRTVEGTVARNPSSSVLISFGVGFGLGVILTSLLSREETWSERHLPDSVRNMPDSIHQLAEAIAKRLPSGLSRS